MRRVCVFCGANPGSSPAFLAAARALGDELVRRGVGLVFGGGRVGLMGAVAETVLAGGGEVVGVIPQQLVDRELAHHGVTRLDVVTTMHERKQRMHDLSDGFVTLPGGYGTLDELFEALTWGQLGMHQKPCGLVDVDGYFRPLVEFLDGAAAAQLLKPEHRRLLLCAPTPAALLDAFDSYAPPEIQRWIKPGEG